MTREDKELLLKDLCARLPYDIKILHEGWNYERDDELSTVERVVGIDENFIYTKVIDTHNGEEYRDDKWPIDTFDDKLFLRPMSSMTEEEKKDLKKEHLKDEKLYAECLINAANGDSSMRGKVIPHFAADWCNKYGFDYRGLIPMGLALEAPEGMYNKEESEKGSEIPIPKTIDEAVKTLAKIVSEEDRDYLLENGAISMHDSMGRWIRNEWGLWTDSELKNELKKKGFEHPDDMSNYIIEEFIKYCLEKI